MIETILYVRRLAELSQIINEYNQSWGVEKFLPTLEALISPKSVVSIFSLHSFNMFVYRLRTATSCLLRLLQIPSFLSHSSCFLSLHTYSGLPAKTKIMKLKQLQIFDKSYKKKITNFRLSKALSFKILLLKIIFNFSRKNAFAKKYFAQFFSNVGRKKN